MPDHRRSRRWTTPSIRRLKPRLPEKTAKKHGQEMELKYGFKKSNILSSSSVPPFGVSGSWNISTDTRYNSPKNIISVVVETNSQHDCQQMGKNGERVNSRSHGFFGSSEIQRETRNNRHERINRLNKHPKNNQFRQGGPHGSAMFALKTCHSVVGDFKYVGHRHRAWLRALFNDFTIPKSLTIPVLAFGERPGPGQLFREVGFFFQIRDFQHFDVVFAGSVDIWGRYILWEECFLSARTL